MSSLTKLELMNQSSHLTAQRFPIGLTRLSIWGTRHYRPPPTMYNHAPYYNNHGLTSTNQIIPLVASFTRLELSSNKVRRFQMSTILHYITRTLVKEE